MGSFEESGLGWSELGQTTYSIDGEFNEKLDDISLPLIGCYNVINEGGVGLKNKIPTIIFLMLSF